MISRIWRGWTNMQNADAYEHLLRTEIFAGIAARNIQGYQGIHLLRHDVPEGVAFVTIIWFDSLEAVRAFAGQNFETAMVPAEARALLLRFDDRSAHYDVLIEPHGNC